MQSERSGAPKKTDKLLILGVLTIILLLYAFFLKDILIPFLKLEIRHDIEGARELLISRGLLGFFSVTLVEALQMVVVFIPAEFIQISSGLSYPFYIAMLLCDLGVCLGATIIYVLVRSLGVQSPVYQKREKQIERFSAAFPEKNVVLLMYLLFFMPVVPFGAICYYGSGRMLSYKNYIRTVATGVIPSILVSNLMGEAGEAFLLNDLPLWGLILVVLLLAALLFAAVFFFIDRFCLRECDETPDSPVYALIFFLVRLWHGRKPQPVIRDELLAEAQTPYILLANHESFFDFYYIHQMAHPRNPTYLVNEFYCTRPVLKTLSRRAGIISKKLFTTELSSPIRIMRTLKKGYSVVIFPEGRLSPDGRSNPIVEEGAAFYRRMNVDLVLVKINGAYFADPKWRNRRFRTAVSVTVEKVVKKSELSAMKDEELNRLIAATLFNDASENTICAYPQKNKAAGLENLLYRCVDCGALYTLRPEGNRLLCTACGGVHHIDESYHFTEAPHTIPGWYDYIREAEKKELDTLSLSAAVRTVIHGRDGGPKREEKGECSLSPEFFSYRSEKTSFEIPTDKLSALAFSCGKEFELYHDGELYYFYPLEQPRQVARWALAVDLLAERRREVENKKETV